MKVDLICFGHPDVRSESTKTLKDASIYEEPIGDADQEEPQYADTQEILQPGVADGTKQFKD